MTGPRAQLAAGRYPAHWRDRECALAAPALALLDGMAAGVHGGPVLVSLPTLAVRLAEHANRGVVSHPMARRVVGNLAQLGLVVTLNEGTGRPARLLVVVAGTEEAA